MVDPKDRLDFVSGGQETWPEGGRVMPCAKGTNRRAFLRNKWLELSEVAEHLGMDHDDARAGPARPQTQPHRCRITTSGASSLGSGPFCA